MTSRSFLSAKFPRDTGLPETTSGSWKSGALTPRSSMVDKVAAIAITVSLWAGADSVYTDVHWPYEAIVCLDLSVSGCRRRLRAKHRARDCLRKGHHRGSQNGRGSIHGPPDSRSHLLRDSRRRAEQRLSVGDRNCQKHVKR